MIASGSARATTTTTMRTTDRDDRACADDVSAVMDAPHQHAEPVAVENVATETPGAAAPPASASQSDLQMNSSFQSVSSLTESAGGAVGEEYGEMPPPPAPASEGGLDDFGDFASEPAAVEQATAAVERAALDDTPAEPMSNVSSHAALSEADFAEPETTASVVSASEPAAEPALNMYNSPHLQAFRAEQARLVSEKEEAEKREIERIKEEAQAEIELMNSQRAKQIANKKQANRERQTAEEQLFANATGWEAVCAYASEENLVENSLTDLSKMRSLLRVLKNTPPVKSA